MYDESSNFSPAQSITAQAVTAAVNGTGVDLAGYDSAMVIFDLGVFAGATPTATLDIQDSPDNATWTSVPSASLIGGALPAMSAAAANQLVKRGYLGSQRYVRAAVTAVGGTSPSLPMSAHVVRGRARTKPVTATE